jgi:hypothetical protein
MMSSVPVYLQEPVSLPAAWMCGGINGIAIACPIASGTGLQAILYTSYWLEVQTVKASEQGPGYRSQKEWIP